MSETSTNKELIEKMDEVLKRQKQESLAELQQNLYNSTFDQLKNNLNITTTAETNTYPMNPMNSGIYTTLLDPNSSFEKTETITAPKSNISTISKERKVFKQIDKEYFVCFILPDGNYHSLQVYIYDGGKIKYLLTKYDILSQDTPIRLFFKNGESINEVLNNVLNSIEVHIKNVRKQKENLKKYKDLLNSDLDNLKFATNLQEEFGDLPKSDTGLGETSCQSAA